MYLHSVIQTSIKNSETSLLRRETELQIYQIIIIEHDFIILYHAHARSLESLYNSCTSHNVGS